MSEKAFRGPLTTRTRKPVLQEIAEALGLDPAGTVTKLLERINAHIKAHDTELSMDPRFQGLTSDAGYRVGELGKTKTTGKTSADKAEEDRQEGLKPAVPPTG